jgi:hypothetical protein
MMGTDQPVTSGRRRWTRASNGRPSRTG